VNHSEPSVEALGAENPAGSLSVGRDWGDLFLGRVVDESAGSFSLRAMIQITSGLEPVPC
jgi:hypothetical protein